MEAKSFTLVEFFLTVQRTDEGHPYWEQPSLDVNGTEMVFYSVDDAVGMARFMLGADHDGPEREPREGYAPLIGIIAHDHDYAHDTPDDPHGWSEGWVDVDGVFHAGDYENDPEYWQANPVRDSERHRTLGLDRICDNPDCRAYTDEKRCRVCGSSASVRTVDDGDSDLVGVEEAWYRETKGELNLTEDPDADDVALVRALLKSIRDQIKYSGSAQLSAEGREYVEGEQIPDTEIHDRVAEALALAWWGWRPRS